MAGNALRKRDNWQTESGPGGLAGSAEKDLIAALNANLDLSTYEVNDHPTDLKHLYEHVVLSDKTLSEIRKPARLFLAKSNVKMVGSKEKNQVLDEATHTKECVNCLPLVL